MLNTAFFRPFDQGIQMKQTLLRTSALLLGLLCPLGAIAQSSLYLTYQGTESEALSFSLAAQNPYDSSVGAGGSTGRASFSALNLSRYVDSQSPDFLSALAQSSRENQVTLRITKTTGGGEQTFIEYTLGDVVVTSQTLSTSSSDSNPPVENLSLAFSIIEFVFTETDPKTGQPGARTETCWDIPQNQPCSARP